MKLSRLENQLRFFEDKKQDNLLLEDALIILNTVYNSYHYDLGRPLPQCSYQDEELFVEGLVSQLYAIRAICKAHENILLSDEELNGIAGELEEYYERFNELNTRKAKLQEENERRNSAKTAVTETQADVDRLEKENAQLQNWLDENPAPDPTLQKEQNRKLTETREKYRKTLANITSLREQIDDLEKEWSDKVQEYVKLEKQEQRKKDSITEKTGAIAGLQKEIPQLTAREAELTNTVNTLNALTAEWDRLIVERCAIRDKILAEYREKLDGLLKDADKEIKTCADKILEMQPALVEKTEELEEKKVRKEEIEKQLDTANENLSTLISEISEKKRFLAKEGEIQTKKQAAEKERDEIQPKYDRLEQLRRELETLEEENRRKEKEIAEADDRKKHLEDAERNLNETMSSDWKNKNTKVKNRLRKLKEIANLLKEDSEQLPEEDAAFVIPEGMQNELDRCIQIGDELEEKIQVYLDSVNK